MIKIIFTGDFSLGGVFLEAINKNKNIFEKEIVGLFKSADYTHINLENPITNHYFREDKRVVSLRALLNSARHIKKNGIKICCLANNHIMDCGINGALDTTAILKKNDILFYGLNNNHPYLIIQKKGQKIALVASVHQEGPLGIKKYRTKLLYA